MTSRIGAYWRAADEMPFLLRLLCKGGMIAGPILLLFLVVPIADWTVNGQRMSYSELWRSGAGISMALFVGLGTLGNLGNDCTTREESLGLGACSGIANCYIP